MSGAPEPGAPAGVVLGIDLGGTTLRGALAALDGTVLAEDAEPTLQGSGSAMLDQIVTLSERLRALASRRPGGPPRSDPRDAPLRAAGIGLPVSVDPRTGHLASTHNVPGLAGVDVPGELRRRLRTPVIVENDVNLAALGELRHGVAAGVDDFVLIAIGTGIGMGIVAGGQLQRGARGGAGEIGFLPFGSDPTTAEAKNGGAFELAAAGPAIRARIQEVTSTAGNRTMLTEGATFAEALRAASAGDVVAQTLVEEEAHLIALGITSVVAILDSALVVLGGGVGANDGLLEPVGRHLATLVLAPPPIVTARLGERATLVGAIAAALDLAHSSGADEGRENAKRPRH